MKTSLKLNSLANQSLSDKAMNHIVGGAGNCCCACAGSSSTADNGNANNAADLQSKRCTTLEEVVVTP